MAKKVEGYIKLQIPAGKATPAPPVGPALGQHGVNIVEFTKQFNAKTADQGDLIIPVVITVYADRSFSFITKTPPAPVLIKKACKIQSGSGEPNKKKVAKITKAQVQEIAELKMPDLNAASLESAMSMIAGTARSMGVDVVMPGDYALVDLPFFQEAIMGIQEIAGMMEYDLLLCIGSGNDMAGLRRIIQNHKVDGVVLLRTMVDDPQVTFLQERRIPFVTARAMELMAE